MQVKELKNSAGRVSAFGNLTRCTSKVAPFEWHHGDHQCRSASKVTIDGKPYCRKHAGVVVLALALKETRDATQAAVDQDTGDRTA